VAERGRSTIVGSLRAPLSPCAGSIHVHGGRRAPKRSSVRTIRAGQRLSVMECAGLDLRRVAPNMGTIGPAY
jgi:hypothetical protein